MTHVQLAVQLFFQLGVILVFCQIVGRVARRFGQPQVVAEMVAGVLLGPSLLGALWPDMFVRLFPPDSMKVLFPVSQLGLAAYMFVVGLEFRLDVVRSRFRSAIAVSVAGMVTPFLLGAGLGAWLYGDADMFPARTSKFEACVFMGASMCITAFPMLARIIHFKRLAGTTMGTVALGAGAIDDAAAWCLLAVVLASFDGSFRDAAMHVLGGLGYVLFVLLVLRPLLARWGRRVDREGELSDSGFVLCLALLSFGAWATDSLGLHAVFGAFVMGMAMPRGRVAAALMERIQPLTVALLLPLFFTFSGLNTRIGLLNTASTWWVALWVFAAAVIGKGVACGWAARWTGLSVRDSIGIGTLMNARGLMELIIINIGLQRGVISPALFACLVLMAVATTLMASPLFEWFASRRAGGQAALPCDAEGRVPCSEPRDA